MRKTLESIEKNVNEITYAFYRYEIKTGMSKLEGLITEISKFVENGSMDENQLKEYNHLLEMILLAVEKKDFLIAADLLKYELLERMLQVSRFARHGERQ